MPIKRISLLSLCVLSWLCGCVSCCGKERCKVAPSEPASTPPLSSTSGSIPKSLSKPSNESYRCETDSDCTVDCAQGAVNKAWFKANFSKLRTCLGGCDVATRSICIEGTCTAIGHPSGKPNPHCTKRPIQWLVFP